MNFEEQISAFMDGALTPQEETEFLHILSVSPEKRALFHSYQGVRAAFVSNARTAAVPSGLDAAILGAAGVAGAIGAAGAGAATGAAAATGSAAGAGIATGVGATTGAGMATGAGAATAVTTGAAAGASAAAFWTAGRVISAILLGLSLFTGGWYLNDWLSTATQEKVDTSARQLSDNSPGTASSNGTATSSGTATPSASLVPVDPSETETKPAQARIVYRNVIVTRIDTVFLPREGALAASEPRATAEPRVEYRYDTVLVALMQSTPEQRPITIVERPFAAPPIQLPGRFEVELQREHLTTWPYIDYNRIGVERAQQHFSASVGYVFDEHHAAGITAGETSFSMEYYRVENDSLFLFQRQPALFYGAGFYRYSQPLLPGLTPEFTLLLGGCDYGPVLGARFGLRFEPVEHLSLLVGLNGNLLTYQYKDNLFNSHNLGLTYGIRYRF